MSHQEQFGEYTEIVSDLPVVEGGGPDTLRMARSAHLSWNRLRQLADEEPMAAVPDRVYEGTVSAVYHALRGLSQYMPSMQRGESAYRGFRIADGRAGNAVLLHDLTTGRQSLHAWFARVAPPGVLHARFEDSRRYAARLACGDNIYHVGASYIWRARYEGSGKLSAAYQRATYTSLQVIARSLLAAIDGRQADFSPLERAAKAVPLADT